MTLTLSFHFLCLINNYETSPFVLSFCLIHRKRAGTLTVQSLCRLYRDKKTPTNLKEPDVQKSRLISYLFLDRGKVIKYKIRD